MIGEGEPVGVAAPRAYRYPVRVSGKDRLSDTALDVLSGSVQSGAVEVPADWVRLFPPGGALEADSLGLGPIGEPAAYAGSGGIPDNARIGDFYELGGATYAIAEHEPTELSEFAAVLLRAEVGETAGADPYG